MSPTRRSWFRKRNGRLRVWPFVVALLVALAGIVGRSGVTYVSGAHWLYVDGVRYGCATVLSEQRWSSALAQRNLSAPLILPGKDLVVGGAEVGSSVLLWWMSGKTISYTAEAQPGKSRSYADPQASSALIVLPAAAQPSWAASTAYEGAAPCSPA